MDQNFPESIYQRLFTKLHRAYSGSSDQHIADWYPTKLGWGRECSTSCTLLHTLLSKVVLWHRTCHCKSLHVCNMAHTNTRHATVNQCTCTILHNTTQDTPVQISALNQNVCCRRRRSVGRCFQYLVNCICVSNIWYILYLCPYTLHFSVHISNYGQL